MENGSHIASLMLRDLELQKYKCSLSVCALIYFFQNNAMPLSKFFNAAGILQTFSECFSVYNSASRLFLAKPCQRNGKRFSSPSLQW